MIAASAKVPPRMDVKIATTVSGYFTTEVSVDVTPPAPELPLPPPPGDSATGSVLLHITMAVAPPLGGVATASGSYDV